MGFTFRALTEKTIHFDNALEAAELAGNRSDVMGRVEQELGVKLVSRDTWMRLEGEADKVETADRFFKVLRKARSRGGSLPEQSILYTLDAFRRGLESEADALFDDRIIVGPGKPYVFPRTFGQREYVQTIRTHDITLGVGPAGTGKTFLAMAMAVATLLEEKVSRIILTRPAIEAGEALGFLPGDMHQKVYPYLRPLYDALYDMLDPDTIQRYMERGVIEVAPLAYMRGRTLNHAFIILDEAQNTTPEQMLMFLTRMGFDSKCVVTGDLTQTDLPPSKTSGLLEASQSLEQVKDIAHVELQDADVVRHALVQKIIKAYRDHRSSRESEES